MLNITLSDAVKLNIHNEAKRIRTKLIPRSEFSFVDLPSFVQINTIAQIPSSFKLNKNYFSFSKINCSFRVFDKSVSLVLTIEINEEEFELQTPTLITIIESKKKINTRNENLIKYVKIEEKEVRRIQLNIFNSDFFLSSILGKLSACPDPNGGICFKKKVQFGQKEQPTVQQPQNNSSNQEKDQQIQALSAELAQVKEMLRNLTLQQNNIRPSSPSVISHTDDAARQAEKEEEIEKTKELIQNMDKKLERCTNLEELNELAVDISRLSDMVIEKKINLEQVYITKLRTFKSQLQKKEELIKAKLQ